MQLRNFCGLGGAILSIICSSHSAIAGAVSAKHNAHTSATGENALRSSLRSEVQIEGILSGVVDKLWAQDDVYWHSGDYHNIISLDRVIVEIDPGFIECYSTGGWLMESLGNNHDAEAFYQLAASRNPNVGNAYFYLGMFYFNTLHEYGPAVTIFTADTQTGNADINDWKMLAHSLQHTGEYAKEVSVWEHIAQKWPNGVAVAINLERARALLRERGPHALVTPKGR